MASAGPSVLLNSAKVRILNRAAEDLAVEGQGFASSSGEVNVRRGTGHADNARSADASDVGMSDLTAACECVIARAVRCQGLLPLWSSHDPADDPSPSASHSSTTVEAVVNLTL